MVFNIKIKYDNQTIVRAKGEHISDFDNIFKDLKRKFGDNK